VTPCPGTPVHSALPFALLLLTGCFDFESLDAASKDGGADAPADALVDGAVCPAPDAAVVGGLPVKRVFVTADTWDGALGGFAGADEKCQTAADSQCLGGEWKAFLSIGNTWAGDRVVPNGAAFALVDGQIIASTKSNLIGTMRVDVTVPIQVTESGEVVDLAITTVWTATDAGLMNPNILNCMGWNRTTGVGGTGRWDMTNTSWCIHMNETPCNERAHLYCFEQ
jgi:hypothetical protein